MAAPRWLARFNRRVTNRLTLRMAPRLPGFGVVVHTGRRTGRLYRTPVNVFPRPAGFVIALTYGSDSEWVHNVIASGGCALETRGRTYQLSSPRLFRDERHRAVPPPIGVILGLLNCNDFLELAIQHAQDAGRDASDDGIGRHVSSHDSGGAENRAAAHAHAR